jgi:hypothetical protein
VEVVYNPLPNALHGPWNLAAVEAGRRVLSEKPFASNASQAAKVRDAGHKAGGGRSAVCRRVAGGRPAPLVRRHRIGPLQHGPSCV